MVDFNRSTLDAALTTGTSPALTSPAGRLTASRPVRQSAALVAALAAPFGPPKPKRPADKIRISFEVYEEFAPALRSAIEEISNDIGARLTGSHRFAKEQALTDAAVALAPLRVAVFAKIPAGDPNYV